MKIIAINSAPTVRSEDVLRGDITDLNLILANIDTVCGRNAALRVYIYALRDLQRAHERCATDGSATDDDIDKAQATVERAFERLIVCQFAINRGESWLLE